MKQNLVYTNIGDIDLGSSCQVLVLFGFECTGELRSFDAGGTNICQTWLLNGP